MKVECGKIFQNVYKQMLKPISYKYPEDYEKWNSLDECVDIFIPERVG